MNIFYFPVQNSLSRVNFQNSWLVYMSTFCLYTKLLCACARLHPVRKLSTPLLLKATIKKRKKMCFKYDQFCWFISIWKLTLFLVRMRVFIVFWLICYLHRKVKVCMLFSFVYGTSTDYQPTNLWAACNILFSFCQTCLWMNVMHNYWLVEFRFFFSSYY